MSLVHPEDIPLITRRIQERLSGIPGTDSVELRVMTRYGELKWIEARSVKIQWQGKPAVQAFMLDITERKRAQEALQEFEERYSIAFRTSPDMMAIINLVKLQYMEVNDSYCNSLGYTREELVGHNSRSFNIWVYPEEEARMVSLIENEGKLSHEEFHFRTKSGDIRIWLCSAETINIGGDKCMLSAATDITERKKAQEKLTESEERFSKAFHASPASISISRLEDHKFIEVNDSFLRDKGFTREEVIGRSAVELGISDSYEASNEVYDTLMNHGIVKKKLIRYRNKAGEIRTGHMSAELISLGNEPCVIILNTDVTKQKEVEAKLKIQKQLNERILATMPEGVLVVNSKDKVKMVNKAFCNIFNLYKKDTKNKLLKDIIDKEQLIKLYNTVKRRKKASHTFEFRHQVNDIEKVIICNILKMHGEQTLLTFTDISREKEEEEKLYLTDRLASIGEMAAGLAHELNNPLTGILALSQLLIDSDIPEEHKEDLKCVFDETRRAADIVKNVLLFARNNNYENGQAHVNDVINSVLRLREYEEKVGNITVVRDYQDNLPLIGIDKYQLQQVVLNIVLNAEAAIKDKKKPGILTVKTERVNNRVDISFTDSGCGIKEKVLPRIFDPFFTTKDIGKGTGLGLSICYGIVVKHGGNINVRSQVNEGSTFTVSLPVADSREMVNAG
jgi:PAS domain S-box-containing protein